MMRTIVHVIPWEDGLPFCGFTDKINPKEWPSGNEFRKETDADFLQVPSEFLEGISCKECREEMGRRLKRNASVRATLSRPDAHICKNPNWIVDIGD